MDSSRGFSRNPYSDLCLFRLDNVEDYFSRIGARKMLAFILAGLVFVITVACCALLLFAAGMSDSPSAAASVRIAPVFIVGTGIAALIAASHWLHIGW